MSVQYISYSSRNSGGGGGGAVTDVNGGVGSITIVGGSGINVGTSGSTITITNTGSSPTGNPDTFAGFDDSGNLYSTPWGIDANGQVTGNFTGTLPLTSVTSLQIFPNITTSLSGGYEGIIVGPNLSSTMAFTSMFNAETTFSSGYNNSGGTGIYQDQSNLNSGATTGEYYSFGSFPQIHGTSPNVSNYVAGASIDSPSLTGFTAVNVFNQFTSGYANTGGTIAFADATDLATGTSTNYYSSAQLSPAFASGSTVGGVQGVTISPNMQGTNTGSYTAIQINGTSSAPIGGNAQGITINLSGVTDSNPQGVMGLSSDSRLNINATTTLQSAQNFQIGNRVESLLHVPPGSPVTGTDSLGNDFAGDLSAEDNIALGPIGLGWASVGFIADMAVAVGKTVAAVDVFVPAVALPDPGYTTGGNVTNMTMVRTFAPLSQGGTVNITNLYGFKIDSGIGGPFSAAGTNVWGLYLQDPALNNFIEGKLGIGNATPTSRLDLPAVTTTAGSSSLKIAAGTLMTTPEQGAVESDGTDLWWTDSTGTRQALNGGGGGGANTALSNLITTAINTDLLFNADFSYNIGSATDRVAAIHCNSIQSGSGNAINVTSQLLLRTNGNPVVDWANQILHDANGDGVIVFSSSDHVEYLNHFKSTQGGTVTATPNANAGTGATSTVSNATDVAGKLELVTGTLPASGAQVAVGFATAYNLAPIVQLTPNNANAAAASVSAYVTSTTSGFTVNFATAGVTSTTYDWFYQVIETQ